MLRNCAILFLLILAACQPAPPVSVAPTVVAFPTMTPGRAMSGALPPPVSVPLEGGLANPATAIALANRPTPTPDLTACPASGGNPTLPERRPATSRQLDQALVDYLSAGGTLGALEDVLRREWATLGANGGTNGDLDLTGEGVAEVIVRYDAPEGGGVLLILGCVNGRYQVRYEGSLAGGAPQIVQTADLNFNATPELVFASRECESEDACIYHTQMVTWDGAAGRFINLLGGEVTGEIIPTIEDVDQDQISELVARLDDPGNAETGPLRTGFTVYDWNGVLYVQSITQLDPPRFRIQVLHEADGLMRQGRVDEAISLYELAQASPSLEPWRSDETPVLDAYTRYRLLLAYAYTEDPRLLTTHESILTTYPDDATAPVYAQMGKVFWNALQVTNNLNSACIEVQEVVRARPEALDLLNRYGSRSPTYTAQLLCPF